MLIRNVCERENVRAWLKASMREMDTLDTFERRDRWRTAWEWLTGDALLAIFVAAALIVGAALLTLPQAPDAAAANAWRVDAQIRLGEWYTPLEIFGLNDVRGSRWLRLPFLGLAALAALRLIDRSMRLRALNADVNADLNADVIDDGRRLRVTDAVLDMTQLQAILRTRQYQVRAAGDVLHATRAPFAELLSILLYVGLLIAVAGLLADIFFGWDVAGVRLNSDAPAVLRAGVVVNLDAASSTPQQVALRVEPGDQKWLLRAGESMTEGSLRTEVRRISPGYRLQAARLDGSALAIRTSNYLSPTESAVVDFGSEDSVTVAVPEAGLVVSLLRAPAGGADQLRAYSVGAAEKVIFAPIEPRMRVGGAELMFETLIGAEIDVRSRPGSAAALLGGVAALLGALGCAIHPMRRITIRRSGAWTEFYADGRGVRTDVQVISRPADVQ